MFGASGRVEVLWFELMTVTIDRRQLVSGRVVYIVPIQQVVGYCEIGVVGVGAGH